MMTVNRLLSHIVMLCAVSGSGSISAASTSCLGLDYITSPRKHLLMAFPTRDTYPGLRASNTSPRRFGRTGCLRERRKRVATAVDCGIRRVCLQRSVRPFAVFLFC
ncbi:hypothetical protein DFH11DRAFT_1631425 [Phellopilus nigrolimitatus]|nr:hypothetical protein DFH11DRAFT_1631425 [Phellopilus nigrolimitatus]